MTRGITDLSQLARYQRLVLEFVAAEGAENYWRQFHPDLSPSGWHLGHCIFTENYWIREVIEGQPIAPGDRDLYVPEFSYKPVRGRYLPAFTELIDWAEQEQTNNAQRLRQLQRRRHPLLKGGYLGTFLVQHYAQHYETLCQVRSQRQLLHSSAIRARQPLSGGRPDADAGVRLPAGLYAVGQSRTGHPYDNEHPRHMVTLAGCLVSRRPLTNREYLGFMQAGGYNHRDYWSEAGWRWRVTNAVQQPGYWCQNDAGHWYGIGPAGAYQLRPAEPVSGISRYEAEACAAWAGGRLPHEHEWEAAARAGLLEQIGRVWEWCGNRFYPYAGFRAWPYEGYSVPYYNDRHFVLRGGSRHTRRVIKRPSFRNYYEADKRHIFAGIRLAYD